MTRPVTQTTLSQKLWNEVTAWASAADYPDDKLKEEIAKALAEAFEISSTTATQDMELNAMSESETMKPLGKLAWEYRGEGLYIYYENPWDKNLKTDLVMFMWPCHDVEAAADVEQTYEKFAQMFCAAWNDRLLKKQAVEESLMMYRHPPGFKL